MKTLIIALNSKYIHSSLAPWYLKAGCGSECGTVKVMEFTINDSPDSVLAELYREKADVAAFSCYICNIAFVLDLVRELKKLSPGIKIVLGGPEVSFDAQELMRENPSIDYVIAGEGDISFSLLLKCLKNGAPYMNRGGPVLDEIGGLSYRKGNEIVSNLPCHFVQDLDLIPSPYTPDMLSRLGDKLVYFESSRGCPFSCSYCLSSTFEGVRYFSLDRVKGDLGLLIGAGAKLVKFVDRTFNCNKSRAKEIFKFVIKSPGETSFHFEAAADLFDDEMLDILSEAPPGKIQFEIGIQSTNLRTLEAVDRKTSLDKAFYNVRRIRELGNFHVHLDLIAGLPYEGYNEFKRSFNQVYGLKPHQFQLGFLKMLKGSKIRREAELHGYIFRERPPYEVLCNRYITFDEMLDLKGIEELVERYYNSGRFVRSLNFIIGEFFRDPFSFYREFYLYCDMKGYLSRPLSSRQLYTVLMDFVEGMASAEQTEMLNDALKFDFLASDSSGNLPEGIKRELPGDFKERCFEFLKNENNVATFLPEFKGQPAKEIFKKVHFETFNYDFTQVKPDFGCKKDKTVVVFNYKAKNRVTGLYSFIKVGL